MNGVSRDLRALFKEDEADDQALDCASESPPEPEPTAKKRKRGAAGSSGGGGAPRRQPAQRATAFEVKEPRLDQWLENNSQFLRYDDGIEHAGSSGSALYDATGSDDDILASAIRIQNVVLALACNMKIDWRFVLPRTQHLGVTYSAQKFGALTMVHIAPKCKTRIFASGKIDCKGAESVADAVRCVQHLIDVIAATTAHDGTRPYEQLRCTCVSLQNMVGMIKLPCVVELNKLAAHSYVKFDRAMFNMAFIDMREKFPVRYAARSEKVLVSRRGFVVITGARGRHCVRQVYMDVADDLANAARTHAADAPREAALAARASVAARRIRMLSTTANNVIFVKPLRIREARSMRRSDDSEDQPAVAAAPLFGVATSASGGQSMAMHDMARQLEEASARHMMTLHSMNRHATSTALALRSAIDAEVSSVQTLSKFSAHTQPSSGVPTRTRVMSSADAARAIALRGIDDRH